MAFHCAGGAEGRKWESWEEMEAWLEHCLGVG